MADFSLSAELRANVANFISGITKSNDVLNKFGSTSEKILGKNGLTKNFKNFASSAGALTAIITAETKALKGLTKAVKEYSEVYRKQLQAETALSVAIKNNPYVSGVASKGLKDFASSLQKVSNYGDEQLLPMMTNLIASGRTEAEVQKIMKAAIDLSATGMMSLDTAVTQLNATLNGNVGRLGLQNAELKNLTKEELESGAAVDILAKKYEGLGEAVKNSSTQLKNVKGDLQEAIGRFTLPLAEWWNKEWLKVYNDTVNWINKINSTLENSKAGKQVMEDVEDRAKNMMKYYKGAKNVRDVLKDTEFLVKTTKDMTDEQLLVYQEYFKTLNGTTKWQRELNKLVENEIGNRKINAENEAKAAKRKEQQIKKENELKQIISDTEAKIKSQELKWLNIEKITGEQVDDAEKIDFYQKTLLDAITDSNGAIGEQHGLYKKILGLINDLKSKSKDVTDNTDDVDKILEGIEAKIKKQELAWTATEKVTGEQVSDVERIDFYQKMLLDAIVDSNGAIGEQHELYKRIYNTIKKIKGESDEKNKNPFKILGEKIREIMSKNFPDLYSKIEDMAKKIEGIVKKIKEKIKDFRDKFKDKFPKLYGMIEGIVKKIKEKIQKIAKYAAILVPVFANICKGIAKGFATAFKTVGKVVSKAVTGVKNAVSKMYSGIKKLIEFSIDDSLDALLKFEDSILTFFVETLPQLPGFIKSVLDSVGTLFNELKDSINITQLSDIIADMVEYLAINMPELVEDFFNVLSKIMSGALNELNTWLENGGSDKLSKGVSKMLKSLSKNTRKFVEDGLPVIVKVIQGIADGVIDWLDNGGIEDILAIILNIQKQLETFVTENLDKIADLIADHVEDFGNFIADSMESANKTLPKLISAVLKVIVAIIDAIAKAFEDESFVKSIVQSIEDVIKEIINILPDLLSSIVNLIVNIITALVPELPGLIIRVVNEIAKAIPNIASQLASSLFDGILKIFKQIFTGDFWSQAFSDIGEGFSGAFSDGGGYGNNSTGSTAGDLAVDLLVPGGFLRHFFATGTNSASRGLALVGEAGPELVNFRGGEQVLNARNTQKALDGMGGSTNNFNVVFNNTQDTTAFAMMQQLKAYNRQMAINGVL